MRPRVTTTVVAGLLLCGLVAPRPLEAYSVLAHEANIDALWDGTIVPMLRARFPAASDDEVLEARAFAYGGCVIQDLGYYPFGSALFSNLLHYVRTGDVIDAMIRDSQNVDEYAFALGALGHYAADNDGHPNATNRVVPLMYPRLRAKFGNRVTYAQSPRSHVLVEFSFDVVQVAAAAYAPSAYHRFIGFEVARRLMERAFADTYGLEMSDIFHSETLAIGTYRHAVGITIPEMTKVAWSKKRDEIRKVLPGAKRKTFVFNLRRRQYDEAFGVDYEKPHGFARFLGFIYRLIPKIGPFRAFAFSVPTPEAERLFLESFARSRERFAALLDAERSGSLHLANTNLDTGRPARRGEYPLADETYDTLLGELAHRHFDHVSDGLRANLLAHYAEPDTHPAGAKLQASRSADIRRQLSLLSATATP